MANPWLLSSSWNRAARAAVLALGVGTVPVGPTAGQALGIATAPGAPPLRLERLGTEHGLSHNTVYAILQDRRGFIWLGTQDGLDRYDGRAFVSFRHEPGVPTALASSWIGALLEDRQGRLWVGTRAGLHRLTVDGTAFERFPLAAPPDPPILALAEGRDGRVWAGTDRGLFCLDPGTRRVTTYRHDPASAASLAGDRVLAVRVSADGAVWALSDSASGRALNRVAGAVQRMAVAQTSAFAVTSSGEIWLDAEGSRPLAAFGATPPGRPALPPATALLEDSTGRAWIGTYQGLYLREAGTSAVVRVETAHLGAGDLSSEVNTLIEDRAGAIWIGTFGGVLRHDPHTQPFAHIGHRPGDAGSLASNAVSAIVEDGVGRIWVGTYGAGVDEFDPATGGLRHHRAQTGRSSPCGDYVWDLAPVAPGRPGIWISTTSGLCRFTPGQVEIFDVPPACVNALALQESADGGLWLGVATGLCHLDPRTRSTVRVGDPDRGLAQHVDVIHAAADGRLWLGGAAAGGPPLGVFDPRSGAHRTYEGVAVAGVWDVAAARDGQLWLATGEGLRRFDPASGRAEVIRLDSDRTGSVHYSVVADEHGHLWIGTNKGLVRYDTRTGAHRRYEAREGTGNTEFNRHAALRSRSGRLWVGGMNGVTSFAPGDIRDNPHKPPVVLVGVRTLGRRGERVVAPWALEGLRLAPDEYAVTLDYAALNFTQSHRNRYRHRLEGLDAGWIDAGTNTSVRYTSLAPGRYTFRVTGSNNDGVWSDRELALPITVEPAFWQTDWFRAGLAALPVAGLLLTSHLRRRRRRDLEQLRLRIAADLHDELGSDLSGIALATSLVGRQAALTGRDRERLADVSAAAVRVMHGLRDIVWYINPEHDTLASMEAKMRALAGTLLPDVHVDFHGRAAGAGGVDMDQRRQLFLIYKELLHNIARHAQATRVHIQFGATDGRVTLEVADNGRGLSSERPVDGTGLRSVRHRAAASGATLDIHSEPGEGTRIRLVVPMTRTRRGRRPRAPVE